MRIYVHVRELGQLYGDKSETMVQLSRKTVSKNLTNFFKTEKLRQLQDIFEALQNTNKNWEKKDKIKVCIVDDQLKKY